MTRFERGEQVTHKLGGRFVVLRRVLLPWGGYLVRGARSDGRLYRRRLRHCELNARKVERWEAIW